MRLFELDPADISDLNDADLRELVARLCEAELAQQNVKVSCVLAGGAQEAADGGLDVHVKNAGQLPKPDFVLRGNTGFQVKKHRMGKAACNKEMLERIDSSTRLKPAIADLADKEGAYIIVSGKDDCSDKMLSERLQGMKDAVQNLPNKDNISLGFYGRDSLAQWLRKHPGVTLWVRSKLGKPLSGWKPFGRWATPPTQNDDFLLDDHPCVEDVSSGTRTSVSLPDGIQLTRDRLRTPGSAVRIIGLSGVGKTRFAQALFEDELGQNALPSTEVIYADLGDDLTPTASELVEQLIANDLTAYVVLDNCPPDVHRKLQKQVAQNNAKLSLLTIEYDISDDRPEETEVIRLEPASEATTSKLIQRRFPDLGRINADKIAEFANGNARVAIALASRVGTDETLAKFSDDDLFQRLFYQRQKNKETLLDSAEVLSLVYSFNISSTEFNNELDALANISGLERRTLKRAEAELFRRQLAQKRGEWRAILPHALANRLAQRALEDITPDEINTELFKPENLRLLKSCAHRLGYLHDFEPARQLAYSWVETGGPLHDIASCDEARLEAFEYIAPVFPETVLEVIEVAALRPGFASRNNKYFSRLVRLLCKLAYEDKHFDRAATVILKFAETERHNENRDSVVDRLQQLFSMRFSGTHASPKRRQGFLSNLLNSTNSRHHEITKELFDSAFQGSRHVNFSNFDFGARIRNSGYSPQAQQEVHEWHEGFIELLKPLLLSDEKITQTYAQDIIASHFQRLWSSVGCFDVLENIVLRHAEGGKWPEMWVSLKRTIRFSSQKLKPDTFNRLKVLENFSAPADLYAEIESYVLTSLRAHGAIAAEKPSEGYRKAYNKVLALGKLAAAEQIWLRCLSPQLWTKNTDAIRPFGRGIAQGSKNHIEIFELIVTSIQEGGLEEIYPNFFEGFISGVYDVNPSSTSQLYECILTIPALKPHFVKLLSATPVGLWGAKKLHEIALSGELEAWQFEAISNGRTHETISDIDLSLILKAINQLGNGCFSTIEILSMRFFVDKNSDYNPEDALLSVGREAIQQIVLMHQDDIYKKQPSQGFGLDDVIDQCLNTSAPEKEVVKIIEALYEGIKNFRLCNDTLNPLVHTLIRNFPELVLNKVFNSNDQDSQHVAYAFFRDRFSSDISALNSIDASHLANWCNNNQKHIEAVATALSVYTPKDGGTTYFEDSKDVVLSTHIKAILEIAEDKSAIAEVIFDQLRPDSWSFGSLSGILEARSEAFAELLSNTSREVQKLAKNKLDSLEETIRQIRKNEAEKHNYYEQRFE